MRKERILGSRLLILVIICLGSIFVISCCISQSKINAKQAEYNRLTAEYENLCAENAEMRSRIEKGKDADNMEKVAREKYGYVYPDEKVYVVTP